MIAFKGVSKDGSNRLGGKRITYIVGQTYKEEESKTAACGFHCCENPVDCLGYYRLGEDRFFKVEAKGDVDEDAQERIACTEMTILKELTIKTFFAETLIYMIQHPKRKAWEKSFGGVEIARDKAYGKRIAIAKGKDPIAKADKDGYIGLIKVKKEHDELVILHISTEKAAGKWYKVGKDGEAVETDET